MTSPSPTSPTDSFDYLPIAAQYTSTNSPQTSSSARMNAYNKLTNGRPSEVPNRKPSTSTLNNQGRSHHSLPPPRRDGGSSSSGHNRMSYHPGAMKFGRSESRNVSGSSTSSTKSQLPTLPDDLERVLTVLANGILEGHIKLAAALRRRYENQYPLVRSLADVFTSHVSQTTLCSRILADIASLTSFVNTLPTSCTWKRLWNRSTQLYQLTPHL